jgi:hypothetical protein
MFLYLKATIDTRIIPDVFRRTAPNPKVPAWTRVRISSAGDVIVTAKPWLMQTQYFEPMHLK